MGGDKAEAAFEDRELLKDEEYRQAVLDTIAALDSGEIRAAEIHTAQSGPFEYHDEITTKQSLYSEAEFPPPGTVRYGNFVEPSVVVTSFLNLPAPPATRSPPTPGVPSRPYCWE